MKVLFLAALLPFLLSVSFAKDDKSQTGGSDSSPNAGLVTLPSGLQYRVLKKAGGKKPAADSTVTVHYVGKLMDGTVVDSSRKRGKPGTFPVNGVIKGWQEGLQLMPIGATYEFVIPPKLGYGARDTGAIPANSTTTWEVELIGFK